MTSARRRLVLVAMYASYRVLVAFSLAVPLASLAARLSAGGGGDAALFEPGGVFLLEAVRLGETSFTPLAAQATTTMLVASLIGLFPLAALIAGLVERGRLSPRSIAARSLSGFPALALAWGAFAFIEAAVFVVLTLVLGKAIDAFGGEGPRDDVLGVIAIGVAFAGGALIGVVHDFVRVAIVVRGLRLLDAIREGVSAFGAAWGRATFAYAWRSVLALALFAGAIAVAPPLAPISGAPPILALIVHQVIVVAVAAVRASWLARAIALVEMRGAR